MWVWASVWAFDGELWIDGFYSADQEYRPDIPLYYLNNYILLYGLGRYLFEFENSASGEILCTFHSFYAFDDGFQPSSYIRDSYTEYLDELLSSEEPIASTTSKPASEASPQLGETVVDSTTYICSHPDCEAKAKAKAKAKVKEYSSLREFKKHIQCHDPPLQCSMCTERCITITHLERHINTAHIRKEEFKCPISDCDRSMKPFPRWDNLKRHLMSNKHDFTKDQAMEYKSTLQTGIWRQERMRAKSM